MGGQDVSYSDIHNLWYGCLGMRLGLIRSICMYIVGHQTVQYFFNGGCSDNTLALIRTKNFILLLILMLLP